VSARDGVPDRPGAASHPTVNAGALWAGGVATAVVAALVAAVGAVVSKVVVDAGMLPAGDLGVLGWSKELSYPAGAAVLALVATAVLHLLLVAVPQPTRFFNWLMALVAVLLAVAPFAYEAARASQIATALVGVITVIAIRTLLVGAARRAMRPAQAA
jgi:hypothetical protein